MPRPVHCFTCHALITPKPGSLGTGYGQDSGGRKHCYACCAQRDARAMVRTGRTVLYWSGSEVTNWPGSLRFLPFHVRRGAHNIGRTRVDAWFQGPDGARWHGVQVGEWNQVMRCERVAGRS